MPLPPTELHAPTLTGVLCTEEAGRNHYLELQITASGYKYKAYLVNPIDLATQFPVGQANIQKRFEAPTTSVQFYRDRAMIEFWGEDGLLSTVKCSDVKLTRA